MKKTLILCVLYYSSFVLTAQEESSKFQVKAANIQFGLYSSNTTVSNLTDFQKLAPNATFQTSDVIGFRSYQSSFGSTGPALSLNLVLAPNTEKTNRLNTEFRFGISYQHTDLLHLNYERKDEFRVDTLTSSNGTQYFVDSISTQNYYLSYMQRHVMIDGDLIISTNTNKRFKLYGGVGFSLGLSIAPQTSIVYNISSRLEQETRVDHTDNQTTVSGNTEYSRNDGGFFGRVYLPIGIDFRIGKTNESLINYHIFLETRPSVNYQSVPELNSITTTANVTSIGLRYDF